MLQSGKNFLIKKLIYKSSYMGCRENDIIFAKFAKKSLNKMNLPELLLYEQLIMHNDAELFAWITGQSKCEAKFQDLLNKILEQAQDGYV